MYISPEELQNYVDNGRWYLVSKHPGLPEEFIEKYKDTLNWEEISGCQTLSDNVIFRNLSKLSIYRLEGNPNIDVVISRLMSNRGDGEIVHIILKKTVILVYGSTPLGSLRLGSKVEVIDCGDSWDYFLDGWYKISSHAGEMEG